MELRCDYRPDETRNLECGSLVIVGARKSNDSLYTELNADPDRLQAAATSSVLRVGDCVAPGTIAHAVYSGHEYARNLESDEIENSFSWERPELRT